MPDTQQRNRRTNQNARHNILPSPYNFVPLASEIFLPDWQDKVAQDVPFRDGLSGSFDLYIKAKTPIFTRDDDNPQQFLNYNGKPFIKGSTIRGMLRNVIKIAAFGKMDTADNQHFAFREFSAGSGYLGMMKPVSAGWLTPDKKIIPCEFARIPYPDLYALQKDRGNPRWTHKDSMPDKYKTWRGDRSIFATLNQGNIDTFANPASPTTPGAVKGTIVFTGYIDSKKREFFFYNERPEAAREVPGDVFTRFEQVHRSSQQRPGMDVAGQAPNEQWAYMKERHEAGENIPIFYRVRDGKLVDMGLAMMYRLPSEVGVHDAIKNRAKSHLDFATVDLADLLFGYVVDRGKNRDSLKGRVSFSHAFLEGSPRPLAPVSLALQAPKASFYPAYVDQREARGRLDSWQNKHASIAGWKRYPAREHVATTGNQAARDDLNTRFQPLDDGSTFISKVYFHNLRPVELGALLWSFTYGGHIEGLVHSLGLARPYGYGQVTLRAKVNQDSIIKNDPDQPDYSPQELIQRFEDTMEKSITGWMTSDQITALLAMANPANGDPQTLRYMEGPQPGQQAGRNGFQNAKTENISLPPPQGIEETKEALTTIIKARQKEQQKAQQAAWQSLPALTKAEKVVNSISDESFAFDLVLYLIERRDREQINQLDGLKFALNDINEAYFQWLETCFEDDEAYFALKAALRRRYYSSWKKGQTQSGQALNMGAKKIKEYAGYLKPSDGEPDGGDDGGGSPKKPDAPEGDGGLYANLSEEEAKVLREIGDNFGRLKGRYNNSLDQDFWSADGLKALRDKIDELLPKLDRKARKKHMKWVKKILPELEKRIKELS